MWVPKQHVYQVSLKSETVGFKFSVILGDLTRNDPGANYVLLLGVPTSHYLILWVRVKG